MDASSEREASMYKTTNEMEEKLCTHSEASAYSSISAAARITCKRASEQEEECKRAAMRQERTRANDERTLASERLPSASVRALS